jgi:hypothetical protein
MAAYAQDSSFFTRRGIVVVIIIALHVLVAWGLMSGLARKVVEVLAPPIEADIVEEVKQDDQPPPPPPPEMERPPVEVLLLRSPSTDETARRLCGHTDKTPPPARAAAARVGIPPNEERGDPDRFIRREPSVVRSKARQWFRLA